MSRNILIILISFFSLFSQILQRPTYSDENSKRLLIPYGSVINYLPVTKIHDITEDDSYYYLATNGGIWRYQKYETEWDYPWTRPQGLPENNILKIFFWTERNILFAETPAYYCVFNQTWQIWENRLKKGFNVVWSGGLTLQDIQARMREVKHDKIKKVTSMPNNAVLTDDRRYTIRGDAVLISPAGEEFPLKKYFTSFREDMIFIIDGFGIGIGNAYDISIKLYRLSVPDVHLRDLLIDGDLYWFGGTGKKYELGGAICVWPDLKSSWEEYYKKNAGAFAHSFDVRRFYANKNHLYAATDNGILEYDNDTDEWQTLARSMNSAYSNIRRIEEYDSLLFLGTDDGLIAWDPGIETFVMRQNPLSNTRIYDLENSRDGLYIACNLGLYKITKNNSYPVPFNYETTIVGGLPLSLFSNKNELWIGTESGWVWYEAESGKWQGKLLNNFRLKGPVLDIAADKNDAFFLVPAGVVHWNREKDIYRLFNKKTGLPGQPHRIVLDGNAIWVVNDTGATQIFFEEVNY